VLLTAAATALREAAGLPALSGARAERYLASARRLGEAAISRLWAQGLAMDSESAVLLALRDPAQEPGGAPVSVVHPAPHDVVAALPNTLTPRERQVVKLIASGRSNKAIAEELFISPATAARHVANILAKLGFSSRTQIAAWAAGEHLDRLDPGTDGQSAS
jgi:DNA-binding NarL/FixJ family response regulator